MDTYSIHAARTHLYRLLEEVQQGRPFLITKAGKPIARVTRVEGPSREQGSRLGFLAGQIEVPEDFDRMGEAVIAGPFGVDHASVPPDPGTAPGCR